MSKAFDPIINNPSVRTRPPCNSAELQELARLYSEKIPEPLIEFWQVSDGVELKNHEASILGIKEISELLSIDGLNEWLRSEVLLPVLYDHESNYICLALGTPLAPRLIYVLHDDSSKLLYRNLDSFWEGCVNLLASNDFAGHFYRESNGDYGPDASRTVGDLAAAISMLKSKEDWDVSIGMQLLDSTCVDQWNELLNGDPFARHDALRRLKAMSAVAAKRILDQDAEQFVTFSLAVCAALADAAIRFEHRDTAIRIDRSWMDLNAFFGRRHIDNAIPRLVLWFNDVQNGVSPTDRPQHFMAD